MNKFLKYLVISLLISFPVSAEKSKLPKCEGDDYTKWSDCFAKIKFPRIEYEGEWKNGMFYGKGIAKDTNGTMIGQFEKNLMISGKVNFIDGSSYEGEFKNDQFHGKGKYVDNDGSFYVGEFKLGYEDGLGKLVYNNGDVMEGQFKNGYLNGKGKYIYGGKLKGDLYEGDWLDGEMTGKAKFIKFKDHIYEGDFERGLYTGKGKIKYEDGRYYEGELSQNIYDGVGKLIYKDGTIYKGEFKNNVEHGKGVMIYSDDVDSWKKYDGEWVDGLESGFGKLEFKNGDTYEGQFKDSSFNGKGKYKWTSGDYYEGNFLSGSKNGLGKYISSEGWSYEGNYKIDELHGKGTYIYSDGSKYIGNFENNCEHGYGEITYKNDLDGRISYKGSWEHCYPSGKGKMVYANGSTFEGQFKDGKKVEGDTKIAKFITDENYYALVIGNNNYQNKEKLGAAVNDANEVSKILKEKYNFKVKTLLNADYTKIVDNLIDFTKDRKYNDNLLIYYAGHGELAEDENKGYWLPVDAGTEQDSKWISNDIVRNRIKATKAKHVLLVVDSCFAGSISRGGPSVTKNTERLNNINLINRFKMRKTRLVITSGGNEPVVDNDGGDHSYFANKFIDVLKNNNNVIQSMYLFQNVSEYVINNANQTPNRTVIFGTGDDGGDFLFFPTG